MWYARYISKYLKYLVHQRFFVVKIDIDCRFIDACGRCDLPYRCRIIAPLGKELYNLIPGIASLLSRKEFLPI